MFDRVVEKRCKGSTVNSASRFGASKNALRSKGKTEAARLAEKEDVTACEVCLLGECMGMTW